MTAEIATLDKSIDKASRLDSLSERLHEYQVTVIHWLQGNALELAVATGVAVLIYVLLTWLRRYANRRANKHQGSDIKAIALRTIARTKRFFRAMVAIEMVNGYANAPPLLANTIHALFTIAVVLQVAIWVREIVLGLIERRAADSMHEHDTLNNAMVIIRLLVSFVIFAIAAIFILDNLGVNVTGLVAGLGVGGIAIGLAAQGIFADLFAAIAVIFDKPFKRGDEIRYGETTARVEKIGMKSVRLRALTGEEKIISNSKLLEMEITNLTHMPKRRITWQLGFIYQTPIDKLESMPELLEDAVKKGGANFVRAGMLSFADSAIDFQLVFDCPDASMDASVKVRHAVGIEIVKMTAREGIEFAYPTQTAFTAAPNGEMIYPYPHSTPKPAPRKPAPKK